MKFVQMSAIAAFTLSLAAGSALAATAGVSVNGSGTAGVTTPAGNANASSNTNASTNNNGPLGIDLSQAGTDAASQRTYFNSLNSGQQGEVSRHCAGMPATTMSDTEKAFCEAIKK